MSWPSEQEHQTQALVFLSVGSSPSLDTCVLKQDTCNHIFLRPLDVNRVLCNACKVQLS